MIALLVFYLAAYSAGAMLMLSLLMALDLLRRARWKRRRQRLPNTSHHFKKAPVAGPSCWWVAGSVGGGHQ